MKLIAPEATDACVSLNKYIYQDTQPVEKCWAAVDKPTRLS